MSGCATSETLRWLGHSLLCLDLSLPAKLRFASDDQILGNISQTMFLSSELSDDFIERGPADGVVRNLEGVGD